tara:strand:+ start:73 stop:321 length:249 start_codon:yes stop_codon:yes gene_type:complete
MGMSFSLPGDDNENHYVHENKVNFDEFKELNLKYKNLESDNEALIEQVKSLKSLIKNEGKIIEKLTVALEKNEELSEILNDK